MKQTAKFSTGIGFILAATGSAVGMGNVWGFPFRVGQNGGGAFILTYLFFVALLSNSGLAAEYAAGRRAGTGTVGAYALAWKTRGGIIEKIGRYIGWLPLLGSLFIALGYGAIVAYAFKALVDVFRGVLMTTQDTEGWFASFAFTNYSIIPHHIFIVAITLVTLMLGAASIEKTNMYMMPAFFLLFVVLAVRVAFLPGSGAGYAFMFKIQWAHFLNPMMYVWAIAQAYFSLSMTGSGMIVYGAYLDDKENLVNAARTTGAFDTLAAIIAGLVVIPACFSYGVDVAGGPGLLYVIMPRVLQSIPLGSLFAVFIYVAIILAGITSLQNMYEAVVESIQFHFPKLSRPVLLTILCVVCLGIGINIEAIPRWGPLLDFTSIYIIPIGATFGAISWFWIMKKEDLLAEVNKNVKKPHGNGWYYSGKFAYVFLAILLCVIALVKQIAF